MLRKRRWEDADNDESMPMFMKRTRYDNNENSGTGMIENVVTNFGGVNGNVNGFGMLNNNNNNQQGINQKQFESYHDYQNRNSNVRRRLNTTTNAEGDMLLPVSVTVNESGRKRPRSECSPSPSDKALEVLKRKHSEDVKRLRAELEYVKTTAVNKLVEAERVNQNLKDAFEEQHKEVSRLVNENKVLKSGIITLNKKREDMVKEQDAAKSVVDLQQEKIKSLENTIFTLRMHLNNQQPTSSTGGGWSGDDRVF